MKERRKTQLIGIKGEKVCKFQGRGERRVAGGALSDQRMLSQDLEEARKNMLKEVTGTWQGNQTPKVPSSTQELTPHRKR